MNRLACAALAAFIACGCTNSDQPHTDSPSAPNEPKPVTQAPKPPSYWEVHRNGKTYVADKPATAAAISRGDLPGNLVTKENFGPAGETIYFTTNDPALLAEWQKQNPKAK